MRASVAGSGVGVLERGENGVDDAVLDGLFGGQVLVALDVTADLLDVLAGGFGEQIASFYWASVVKVLNFGAKKEFTDNVPLETLYEQFHLTPELIVKDILDTLA